MAVKTLLFALLGAVALSGAVGGGQAGSAPTPPVPDWALPGSATHKQVPPPSGFHRSTRTTDSPLGIFTGQSDVGGPLVAGSSSYNPSTGTYRLRSAGYNIWYSRDEFRFVWKQMGGDFSLGADPSFPDPDGYNDRKAVLVIRQSLDDDAAEVVVAEHGTGMVHIAERPSPGAQMTDMEYRFGGTLAGVMTQRIGLEKHGDLFTLYASIQGEPMHPLGPPVRLAFSAPFYVGIGFCSHLPTTVDTAVLSHVELAPRAGQWSLVR